MAGIDGLGICLVLTGIFYGKKLNKMSMLTLPDFYYRRYGNSAEGISAILMLISFIVLVAGNFAASGFILSSIFQIDLAIAAFWAAFIFFAGGFSGVNFGTILGNAPPGYLDLSGLTSIGNGALTNWASIMALGLGDIVALDFMERVFAAKDGKTAQRGALMGGGLTFLTVVPTSMMGIVAFCLLH